MTAKRLRELAKEAGYEIRKGFTHSEEGSRKAGQSGYEIVNLETGEAVTRGTCGETWHFAYTLEEVEDFLKSVYEQAEMAWEPENGATLEDIAKAVIEPNEKYTELIKQIDEDKRIRLEAYDILDRIVQINADIKREDCREMFSRVEEGLKAEWEDAIGDPYELRLKLFLILLVLNTTNMDIHSDELEPEYTDSLNGFAEEIVKYKIRFGELNYEVVKE
ncbi:MAG: hypothetical protein SOW08_05645 [Lachnospiraceae bacterium]|nr:hypothetical protein [Lachnospiraceae bacterium]